MRPPQRPEGGRPAAPPPDPPESAFADPSRWSIPGPPGEDQGPAPAPPPWQPEDPDRKLLDVQDVNFTGAGASATIVVKSSLSWYWTVGCVTGDMLIYQGPNAAGVPIRLVAKGAIVIPALQHALYITAMTPGGPVQGTVFASAGYPVVYKPG